MAEVMNADGSAEPLITLVPRTEEILDPNMDPITKVGTMARICYRSEPKDGEDENAVNERIIRKCIADGHESVLEHGVYSVFIPVQEVHDSWKILGKLVGDEKKTQGQRVDFRRAWQAFPAENQTKYLFSFNDPEIMASHYSRNAMQPPEGGFTDLPCVMGNVRAWRNTLKERFFITFHVSRDPLHFILTAWVLYSLNKVAPIFFEDIVKGLDEFIKGLPEVDPKKPLDPLDSIFYRLDKETRGFDTLISTYLDLPDDLYAEPAAPCASFSVIFTTDRATTHQLVRHRKDVGYSQESQRYVNYDKKGLRIIPLTLEPAKFEEWCGEHNRTLDDIFSDCDTGRVRADSVGAYYYIPWYDGAICAAQNYKRMLNLKEYWGNKSETGNLDLPDMPVETARDKLENDTATRIGVTWIMQDGLANLLFWRLDSHAQYALRSMLGRVIVRAMGMKHPFFDIIDYGLRRKWLSLVSSQGIFRKNDEIEKANKVIDDFVARLEAAQAAQRKAIEAAQKKAEAEARRLAEEKKANPDDPNAGVPTPDENGDLPRTQRPIIKIGRENPNPSMTEEKVNPPSVSLIKPKEEAPAPTVDPNGGGELPTAPEQPK